MTLQDICTSLELSKQLKEAGYQQEDSLFYWNEVGSLEYADHETWVGYTTDIAAPTAAEIGERLPVNFSCNKGSRMWVCRHWWGEHPNPLRNQESGTHWHMEKDKGEAEARAKMWLYLKKEGLL